MDMSLKDYCSSLAHLASLTSEKKALAILLWHEISSPGAELSPATLSRIMKEYGLGNPNSTTLRRNLGRTRLVLKSSKGFRLKAGAGRTIQPWLGDILDHTPSQVDQRQAYLPETIWTNTRGYLEKICAQLNGCYKFGFFDAASVMMRRVIETLIIEAYECLKREDEIKGSDGNYFMLGELVISAIGPKGINLGREAKGALSEVKKLGDRSAHNRRFNAIKPDMDGTVRSGFRLAVEELINLASLRHHP